LTEAGVTILGQSVVDRIETGSVDIRSVWGGAERSLEADTVILSMMRRSDDSLHRSLTARGIAATRIGDCLAPREVDDAIYEGFAEGRRIGRA